MDQAPEEKTDARKASEPGKAVSKQYLPRSFTGFVEMCGRHPFATGLFALLGIFGLLFSFFTFGVDQVQTRQDNQDSAALKSSISRVEVAVKEAAPVIEAPDFDPVASSMSPASDYLDNIAFNRNHSERSLEWVASNVPDSFTSLYILVFSLHSAADKDFVQIAPYLVVDVISADPIPDDTVAINHPGRGGAAEAREFTVAIVPKSGLQFAPLIDGETGDLRRGVDYFALMPREPEEFFLHVNCVPGYVYTLRFGVQYKYKGAMRIHWMSGPIRAGIPDLPLPIRTGDSEYVTTSHPYYYPDLAEEVTSAAAINLAWVERGKVFRPDILPD